MLKAGIFLDMENLWRNGGWGIRYDVVRQLVEKQNSTVLRANAYMAYDETREDADFAYRQNKEAYRGAIRRNGFHLVLKEVKRWRNEDGEEVVKANADLDLAVDAMLQSENLDYVLLGTGDGDFVRLVRALQARGKRVDVLSFANTSNELKQEADSHVNGFLIPGLVRNEETSPTRHRGYMRTVDEAKGFGFLVERIGLGPTDVFDDVFLHISDFARKGEKVSNSEFASLKTAGIILEYDIEVLADTRQKARNVTELLWAGSPARV